MDGNLFFWQLITSGHDTGSFFTCPQNLSHPRKKNGHTGGRKKSKLRKRKKRRGQGGGGGGDKFLLAIFFCSPLFLLFLPLFVFAAAAYQIPAPFKASVRGRSQTPPSLFHSISSSLLLSRALPLLTFENKSLEFEFQSEQEQEEGL